MDRASVSVRVHLGEPLQAMVPQVLACCAHFGCADPVVAGREGCGRNGERGDHATRTGRDGHSVQESNPLDAFGGPIEILQEPLPDRFRNPKHRLDPCSRGE